MALGQDIDRLRRLPVFACLDAEALTLVAFSAQARRLPAGHVLFRRGEVADAAVLLATGMLALDEETEDRLSVSWALAGTLLNETALFAPGMQTVTATAQEACTVVAVPHTLMMRVLEVHPGNAEPLRRYWADRLGRRLAGFRSEVRP
ncbi:Crp/Fnr family transcriptional regulator [Lichenibacterium minor]|uniref:Crp/Fnr family transcriptional regulator n=1 Tax=Lichenibacterium minor TaxID=2316528 RepID=A0A4Q2U643_9HYPH|nr:Crp/Fnr family transcriptional regulator [Lichenibacterium minor]RYC30551.1 Crp/Fnr family transcriptional regulator [Lichenibacterium minor]